MKPLIAITMGDPAGIGPEIILKSCKDEDIHAFCRPVVIGNAGVFEQYKKKFNLPIEIIALDSLSIPDPSPDRLYIINAGDDYTVTCGRLAKEGGQAAAESIKKAVALAVDGKIDAITTAPINKEGLHLAGYRYAGHTEMLADLTNTKDVAMMLAGGDIRVVLSTIHTAINNVSSLLTIAKIERFLDIIHNNMDFLDIKAPKIAVAALNPHAGEDGLFGREEIEIIIPAVANAAKRGIDVEGPFPADTLFVHKKRKKFDVILVMYHDQGLIPLKMTAFGKSVNITLGLPIIRTSVDHGTAYDIAGKNIADPSSMKEALKIASTMTRTI